MTVIFEPIPQALQTIAPPTTQPAPSDTPSPPVSAAQPTPLPTQRDIVLSALRRHAGPYLVLAPYIPTAMVKNVGEISGQPTDDLLAVFDITTLHNGRNGLYFYPDRLVSKQPVTPALTIYYASLLGRSPRAGMFTVDYGDGMVLEANFDLQHRIMLTVDDIIVSLTALPEFRSGMRDGPASRLSAVSADAARCQPVLLTLAFRPDSLAVPAELMPRIIEDRPGCAITSVRLVGYANTSSSREQNQALSLQRANALRTALVAAGVSDDKITVEGHGDTEIPTVAGDPGPAPIGRPTLIIVKF